MKIKGYCFIDILLSQNNSMQYSNPDFLTQNIPTQQLLLLELHLCSVMIWLVFCSLYTKDLYLMMSLNLIFAGKICVV